MKTNLWLSVLTIALVFNIFMMCNPAQSDTDPGIRKEHLNQTAGAFVDGQTIEIGANGLQVTSAIADKAYVDSSDNAMHDTEGGYNNCDVNGSKTKVYTKYITGTMDNDTETQVLHGVTAANILHVSTIIFDGNLERYRCQEIGRGSYGANPAGSWDVHYDNTTIYLANTLSYLQGQDYKIRVDYTN